MYLVVLELASHHAEGIVDGVMVDVDLGHALGGATGHPALVAVIVHHDSRPRCHDGVLTVTHTQSHIYQYLSCLNNYIHVFG